MTRPDLRDVMYEKCAHCHLFVEKNPWGEVDGPPSAPLMHLARGDEADDALEATHDAAHSGDIATLSVWMKYGPLEMRNRFLDVAVDGIEGFLSDFTRQLNALPRETQWVKSTLLEVKAQLERMRG